MGFSSLKTYPWHEVNYIHIIELKRILIDRGLKPASINTYLAIFKGAVREAWRLGLIDIDTYMRIKDVKRVRGDSELVGKALEATEINRLVNYKCKKNRIREIRDSAIIAVCYGAGLRRSEIVKLDLSDYSDNKLIINGKGGYVRTMYIPKFAIDSLNQWLEIRGNDEGVLFNRLLIGDRITDQRLAPCAIIRVINRRCRLVDIERITPHDLRRSYATNLISSGVDIFTVQKLMRHANIETTKRYDMRGEEVKKAAVDILPF